MKSLQSPTQSDFDALTFYFFAEPGFRSSPPCVFVKVKHQLKNPHPLIYDELLFASWPQSLEPRSAERHHNTDTPPPPRQTLKHRKSGLHPMTLTFLVFCLPEF